MAGASEAFLTSSLRGVAPLVRVGTQPLGDGEVGALTRCLIDAYAALVERECLA
jgi:branched-subunit amino acid aminotransferase/4-amino-4-deoxychorismate lyase